MKQNSLGGPTSRDPSRLSHALEVHPIELETQNEELRAARVEIEAALRRYTELFDFAPIGYAVLDAESTLDDVNFEGARLLGAPRTELLRRPLLAFVTDEDRPQVAGLLGRVLTTEGEDQPAESCEATLFVKNGRTHEVRFVVSALAGLGPPARKALVAMHDVAARKRAETALLEESRHKDEFLATLSHELRNPLSSIRSSLYVLDRLDHGDDRSRRTRALINRQVNHLVQIVDDLLEVTRIGTGKIRLECAPLELGALVGDAIADQSGAFEDSGIALHGPIGAREIWVDADATRLAQVFGNLLINALKFTSRGGRVDVTLRDDRGAAVVSVRDNGVGIAEDVRDRLFRPFTQAPQTLDQSRGGLGLGLAMVKGLVELHRGSVAVSSAGIGWGSEFTVRLPTVAPPAKAAIAAPSGVAPERRRVLVIEDNVDAGDSLCTLLTLEGHDVRLAYDGPSGLLLAQSFRPEVVLCNLGLPEIDGYEVARKMRADSALRSARLVALSGYARPEDRRRSIEAGFDVHVAKPVDLDELEKVLRTAPMPHLA